MTLCDLLDIKVTISPLGYALLVLFIAITGFKAYCKVRIKVRRTHKK